MKSIFPQRTPSFVVKLFRLFGMNIDSKEPLGSLGDVSAHMSRQPKTFNVQTYLLGIRRMHEIEAQKAMVIFESRHDKWKAGGPL